MLKYIMRAVNSVNQGDDQISVAFFTSFALSVDGRLVPEGESAKLVFCKVPSIFLPMPAIIAHVYGEEI